tara:strand:+ start:209 stop:568 length:360 start_codon:yes stop_codon:yes gene_type:complete
MNSQTKRRKILGIDATCDDSESYAIDLAPIMEEVEQIEKGYRAGKRTLLSAIDALTECRHDVSSISSYAPLSTTAKRMGIAALVAIYQTETRLDTIPAPSPRSAAERARISRRRWEEGF